MQVHPIIHSRMVDASACRYFGANASTKGKDHPQRLRRFAGIWRSTRMSSGNRISSSHLGTYLESADHPVKGKPPYTSRDDLNNFGQSGVEPTISGNASRNNLKRAQATTANTVDGPSRCKSCIPVWAML